MALSRLETRKIDFISQFKLDTKKVMTSKQAGIPGQLIVEMPVRPCPIKKTRLLDFFYGRYHDCI
jgi:hypothetical protein